MIIYYRSKEMQNIRHIDLKGRRATRREITATATGAQVNETAAIVVALNGKYIGILIFLIKSHPQK